MQRRSPTRFSRQLVAMLCLALSLLAGGTAAQAALIGDTPAPCFAASDPAMTTGQFLASQPKWECDTTKFTLQPEQVALRFAIDPAADSPRIVILRRAAFSQISAAAIDSDGTIREVSGTAQDTQVTKVENYFSFALPEITAQTQSVVVTISHPTRDIMLTQARLLDEPPGSSQSDQRILYLLALACGMLLMPIVLDVACLRALRESFLLWHSLMATMMMAQVALASGLASEFFGINTARTMELTSLSFTLSIACAAMFSRTFIEQHLLHPAIRSALLVIAWWSAGLGVVHSYFPFFLRPIHNDLFYAAFLPVFIVVLLAIIQPLLRGSRAARFQLVAWTPLIMVGALRLVGQFVPSIPQMEVMALFYVGAVFEVVVTMLGVADRFQDVCHQRDRAIDDAQILGELSERDPLTGLLNRRAVDQRFDELVENGFCGIAVIDLDHFKAINDVSGHAVGDDVLQVCGDVLQSDNDAIGVRLGGEEFMLLLRGKNGGRRAEKMRRAISMRVAREVGGLEQIVTASMGYLHIPSATGAIDFSSVYSRADLLLYEAKNSGRNRTVWGSLAFLDTSDDLVTSKRMGDAAQAA